MSGYIGTQPVPQATQTRDSFTCTAGQTSFATGGYTPTYLDVYLNGIFLSNGADYTASNGSDVILTAGAAAGDILEVVAYTTFDTANVTGADDFTVTGSFTSQGIDDNATSTAMTLDSSGNLLVGKTSTGINTAGTRLIGGGSGAQFTADGTEAVALNRLTSDGDLIWFGKAGSKVGSIATDSNTLRIGGPTSTSGLGFYSSAILPQSSSTALADTSVDLGSSFWRFKDAYLSGGVYLGGTGSANHLDDYEEGTWTPVLAGSTTAGTQTYFGSYTNGRYRKVGSLVIVSGSINLLAFDAATAGDLHITNLPFTPVMGSNVSTTGLLSYSRLVPSTSDAAYVIATNALSYLRLRVSNPTGAGVAITTSDSPNNNTGLGFSVSYYV